MARERERRQKEGKVFAQEILQQMMDDIMNDDSENGETVFEDKGTVSSFVCSETSSETSVDSNHADTVPDHMSFLEC